MPRDGTLRVVSNTTKLADMENVDVLQFEVGGQGTMYVYPILCSVTTDGKLTTGAGGYGISLPYIQELEVKCVDAHKAELEWNDSSYIRLTGSSYVATIYINYSKVQYVGDSINGYIYVCAATANGQPLGDWERIDGIYTVNLSSSSGTATLSTFAIYPNSIKGSNSESFAGYLVRFTPTSYEYASSVYGFCIRYPGFRRASSTDKGPLSQTGTRGLDAFLLSDSEKYTPVPSSEKVGLE